MYGWPEGFSVGSLYRKQFWNMSRKAASTASKPLYSPASRRALIVERSMGSLISS